MKLVQNRTIPIFLSSGKNIILADMMFYITIGYINLDMVQVQIQSRHGRNVCPFTTLNANMAGYPTKNYVFICEF